MSEFETHRCTQTIYPLVGVAANLALVVAGHFTKTVNGMAGGCMLTALRTMVATVVALTGVMWGAKALMDAWFGSTGKPATEAAQPTVAAKKPKKKKGSMGSALATLRSSSKILHLACLVIGYGLSHRVVRGNIKDYKTTTTWRLCGDDALFFALVLSGAPTAAFPVQFDVAWKHQLRVVYPTPQAYQGVLANVSIATGLLTMALMLTGKFVFQYMGWTTAAVATPIVMAVSGAAFFGLSLAAQFGWSVPGVASTDLALIGVTAGVITQVFARSSKFSLFDPAKEMVCCCSQHGPLMAFSSSACCAGVY